MLDARTPWKFYAPPHAAIAITLMAAPKLPQLAKVALALGGSHRTLTQTSRRSSSSGSAPPLQQRPCSSANLSADLRFRIKLPQAPRSSAVGVCLRRASTATCSFSWKACRKGAISSLQSSVCTDLGAGLGSEIE